MSDPKKLSTMTMVLIGIGVLGLCCVGSCGVAMIGGVAAGSQSPIASAGPTSGTGIEGAWSYGSISGFTEYRNVVTGAYAPPSGTGARFEFKPGGSCEHYALLQSSMGSCTSTIFIAHADCEWELDGKRLTVNFGDGDQLLKPCGGQQKRSTTDPMTVEYGVAFTADGLELTEGATTLRLRRE